MAIIKYPFIYSIDINEDRRLIRYDNLRFSAHSQKPVSLEAALVFAEYRKGVLQSLEEAAAFRSQAQGQHNADRRNHTRSCIVTYPVTNGHRAFVDHHELLDSLDESILPRGGVIEPYNPFFQQARKQAEQTKMTLEAHDYSLAIPVTNRPPLVFSALLQGATTLYLDFMASRGYSSLKLTLSLKRTEQPYVHPLCLAKEDELLCDAPEHGAYACAVRNSMKMR